MTNDTITLIVWSVFAALAVASILAYITEQTAKDVAKKLIEANATDTESAKTLRQIGFKGAFLTLASFGASRGSRIGRAIGKVMPEAADSSNQSDLLFQAKPAARYYLPKDAVDKSFNKHMNERTPVWKLLAALIVLLLAALAASSVIRFLGRYASNVPNSFKQDVYGTDKDADTLLEEQEKLMEQDILEAEEAAKEAAEEEALKAEADESGDEDTNGEDNDQETGTEE